MGKVKTGRSLHEKTVDFLKVQLWIQKIRYQSLGKWYFLEATKKILDNVFPIFNSFIQGLIINEVIAQVVLEEKDLTKLVYFVGASLTLSLIQSLFFTTYNTYSWLNIQRQFELYLDRVIMDKLTRLNWEHIEVPKTEKLINMTFQKSKWYIPRMLDIHFDVIAIIISMIAAFSLASIPVIIIPILILKELPKAIVRFIERKKFFVIADGLQNETIRMYSIISYFRSFKTLMEIKLSNVAKSLLNFRKKKNETVTIKYKKATTKYASLYLLFGGINTVFNSGVFIFYLEKVLYQGMLIGTFNFTTSAIFNLSNSIDRTLANITQIIDNYRYVRYFYDLLQLKNTHKDGKKILKGENIKIEFKNVWFKYPLAKNWSLKNVNLVINDNDHLAIVGENGAGKSTFLKLLMLAYYPTKGEILINDIPLTKYKKSSVSAILSLVSQEFARYDVLDVKQNIAIYTDIEKIDKKKLHKAAKYATADEFIDKLDHKYDTLMAKRLEGGTELSSGQWQRLAVARQFYSNRPLIILDEPTSAIDPIAEAKIFDNLYHHVKNKTVIVVSHRYNTVKAAKSILVFKDGKIIEFGTHKELLDKKGYYAKAYEVQNQEKKL